MADERPVRILLADDHTLLREALGEVLHAHPDFEVIAEVGTGEEAVRLAAEHRPDVVLLDVEMPHHNVADTVRTLRRIVPPPHIIVLSMYDDPKLVRELLALGVRGYLHKNVSRESLISAIRGLTTGDHTVVTVAVSRNTFATEAGPDDDADSPALSAREREVLRYVAAALSNRQIANRIGVTEGTVKRHLHNIFAKLDAVSRIDAVNKATKMSLITGPVGTRGYRAG